MSLSRPHGALQPHTSHAPRAHHGHAAPEARNSPGPSPRQNHARAPSPERAAGSASPEGPPCGLCGMSKKLLQCARCTGHALLRWRVKSVEAATDAHALRADVARLLRPHADTDPPPTEPAQISKHSVAARYAPGAHERHVHTAHALRARRELLRREQAATQRALRAARARAAEVRGQIDAARGRVLGRRRPSTDPAEEPVPAMAARSGAVDAATRAVRGELLEMETRRLCRDLVGLLDIHRRRKKPAAASSTAPEPGPADTYMGYNVVPRLLALGQYPSAAVNAATERVAGLCQYLAAYLRTQLPYPIELPTSGRPYVLIGMSGEKRGALADSGGAAGVSVAHRAGGVLQGGTRTENARRLTARAGKGGEESARRDTGSAGAAIPGSGVAQLPSSASPRSTPPGFAGSASAGAASSTSGTSSPDSRAQQQQQQHGVRRGDANVAIIVKHKSHTVYNVGDSSGLLWKQVQLSGMVRDLIMNEAKLEELREYATGLAMLCLDLAYVAAVAGVKISWPEDDNRERPAAATVGRDADAGGGGGDSVVLFDDEEVEDDDAVLVPSEDAARPASSESVAGNGVAAGVADIRRRALLRHSAARRDDEAAGGGGGGGGERPGSRASSSAAPAEAPGGQLREQERERAQAAHLLQMDKLLLALKRALVTNSAAAAHPDASPGAQDTAGMLAGVRKTARALRIGSTPPPFSALVQQPSTAASKRPSSSSSSSSSSSPAPPSAQQLYRQTAEWPSVAAVRDVIVGRNVEEFGYSGGMVSTGWNLVEPRRHAREE